MLIPVDNFLGINILARVHGSAAYKALIPSLISTGLLLALHYSYEMPNDFDDRWFGHPYPLASVVVAFTFLLTFKCSFSYNRYWEACTAVHQMHSKWLDCGIDLAAFHMQSNTYKDSKPPSFGKYPTLTRLRKRVKTPSKRTDMFKNPPIDDTEGEMWSCSERLITTPTDNRKKSQIPVPSRTTHGDPSSLKRRKSSIDSTYSNTETEPSLFLQEAAHLLSLLSAVALSTLRGDMEGVDIPLKTYIPGSPWPAMDPDADADVKQESHNYYHSSKVTRMVRFLFNLNRNEEQQTIYNSCRQFGVLGGTSDEESNLLRCARGPFAKTALCSFWLQEFISREYEAGSLGKTAPPIVSRLYQFTSDGMIGYNQARKVAYVPFPFPHTQLTTLYVLIMLFFLPILMLSFCQHVIVAAILNALSVTVFVGLHEVAKELEEPFRNAPNDLPLNNFNAQFNEALIAMYAGYHPESWWSPAYDDVSDIKPQVGDTL